MRFAESAPVCECCLAGISACRFGRGVKRDRKMSQKRQNTLLTLKCSPRHFNDPVRNINQTPSISNTESSNKTSPWLCSTRGFPCPGIPGRAQRCQQNCRSELWFLNSAQKGNETDLSVFDLETKSSALCLRVHFHFLLHWHCTAMSPFEN